MSGYNVGMMPNLYICHYNWLSGRAFRWGNSQYSKEYLFHESTA